MVTCICIEEEIEFAISKKRYSSVREDEVISGVIKKTKLIYKRYITWFFAIYLSIAYHFSDFKVIIFYALLKPRKIIYLKLQVYCLITLLSFLEKISKNVIARQLDIFALKIKLFSKPYFELLPGRLGIDVAATLIHHTKKTTKEKNMMSDLAFFIKGVFDNVLKNNLIK